MLHVRREVLALDVTSRDVRQARFAGFPILVGTSTGRQAVGSPSISYVVPAALSNGQPSSLPPTSQNRTFAAGLRKFQAREN